MAEQIVTDEQLVRALHSFLPTAGYLALPPLTDDERQSLLAVLARWQAGAAGHIARLELGADDNGVRFVFERDDPHIARGPVVIDVWDGADGAHDAASVTLTPDDVLTLAQTLDDWLDR